MTILGPYVFLSYAKEDRKIVLKIYAELTKIGVQVWFDEHLLNGGDDWDRQIRVALNGAKFVVFCLSTNSVSKTGYVQRELKLALTMTELRPPGEVFIVPARLDPNVKPTLELGRYQYIDVFKRGGVKSLATQIAYRMGISHSDIVRHLRNRSRPYKSKLHDAVVADVMRDAAYGRAFLMPSQDGKTMALTNGIWIDFNPTYLTHENISKIKDRISAEKLGDFVSPVKYRNADNEVLRIEFSGNSLVKICTKNAALFFNRKYFNWMSVRYPDKKMYLTGPGPNALIVDDADGPLFMVMPVVAPVEKTQ